MVKLTETFRYFRPIKALCLGDFMLDTYTSGKVKKVSPEAPVGVMEVYSQESRPGGAGNVVLNLLALGSTVYAVGRIGDDAAGHELLTHFQNCNTENLFFEKGYQTPIKNRLIADSQQLLRIDHEKIVALDPKIEQKVIEKIIPLIEEMDVVVLSDYAKGFLSDVMIKKVLKQAKDQNIPTIVDPKGIDFSKYRDAFVIKPNLMEAILAAKCEKNTPLETVARNLKHLCKYLLITRSESGISIFDAEERRFDFPVLSKEVKDVTGAGDTVSATISFAVANKLDIQTAAELANIAAGLCIERLGCAQITLSEIAERLLEIDSETKIFDESHTFALSQILQGKKYSLLVLNENEPFSLTLFQSIRSLRHENELILYLPDYEIEEDFIHLLSTLDEVSYIIRKSQSLKNLLQQIHPDKVFIFKDNKLETLEPLKNLLDTLLQKI